MNNLIIVTDWEKVDADDFYLTDEWAKSEDMERIEEARKLQKEGRLYFAYIVDAKNYAIYYQMDADCVYVDDDCNVMLSCESAIIGNSHEHREEYSM